MDQNQIIQSLLPKRREILETIRDHEMASFDFIRRRFMAVSKETIHYDLQQLIKTGLIRKLGKTRGALYSFNSLKNSSHKNCSF